MICTKSIAATKSHDMHMIYVWSVNRWIDGRCVHIPHAHDHESRQQQLVCVQRRGVRHFHVVTRQLCLVHVWQRSALVGTVTLLVRLLVQNTLSPSLSLRQQEEGNRCVRWSPLRLAKSQIIWIHQHSKIASNRVTVYGNPPSRTGEPYHDHAIGSHGGGAQMPDGATSPWYIPTGLFVALVGDLSGNVSLISIPNKTNLRWLVVMNNEVVEAKPPRTQRRFVFMTLRINQIMQMKQKRVEKSRTPRSFFSFPISLLLLAHFIVSPNSRRKWTRKEQAILFQQATRYRPWRSQFAKGFS